jgi:serine/threonine protein kinase
MLQLIGARHSMHTHQVNYIEPEVLFDMANGHSFEVDTWSNGVILYTFVVGCPAFPDQERQRSLSVSFLMCSLVFATY